MKYRITTEREDVACSVYKEFEAKSDAEAQKVFEKIANHKDNAWDHMELYRIDVVEKTTYLSAVR